MLPHPRATARACLIAASASGPAVASRSMARETVGSEATGSNTQGCARSTAMSAAQSPPSATVMARSVTILAGSWIARAGRHRRRPVVMARSRPLTWAVWVSSAAPAVEINDSLPVITDSQGRNRLGFTCGVPFWRGHYYLRQVVVSLTRQALSLSQSSCRALSSQVRRKRQASGSRDHRPGQAGHPGGFVGDETGDS